MSHFYGTLQGTRGGATRCGSIVAGMTAVAASWKGAIAVRLYNRDGVDHFTVTQEVWRGSGVYEVIAQGTVGKPCTARGRKEQRDRKQLLAAQRSKS